MSIEELTEVETKTADGCTYIACGPYKAYFRHDEMLLGFTCDVMLDESGAIDYADFVRKSAKILSEVSDKAAFERWCKGANQAGKRAWGHR